MNSGDFGFLNNKHTFNRIPEEEIDELYQTSEELDEIAEDISKLEEEISSLKERANRYRKYFGGFLIVGTLLLILSFILSMANPLVEFRALKTKFLIDSSVYNMLFYTSLSIISVASILFQLNQNTETEIELLYAERNLEKLEKKRDKLAEKEKNIFQAFKIYKDITEEVEDVYPGYISIGDLKSRCRDKKKNAENEEPYNIVLDWIEELRSSLQPDFFKDLQYPIDKSTLNNYNQLIWKNS